MIHKDLDDMGMGSIFISSHGVLQRIHQEKLRLLDEKIVTHTHRSVAVSHTEERNCE